MSKLTTKSAVRDEWSRLYHEMTAEIQQVWASVLEGKYKDALVLWEDYIAHWKDFRDYHTPHWNRGITRLLVGDYEGALADFQAERQLQLQTPYKTINMFIGVVLWLKGEHATAAEDWAAEIKRLLAREVAGDIEAPALLWWASAHPELSSWRKLAEEGIKRVWGSRWGRQSLWPGSLAPYLLSPLEPTTMIIASSSQSPELEARYRCQAHFYIGAKRLDQGDAQTYQQCLRFALSPGHIIEAEYHLARGEHMRLSGVSHVPVWTHSGMLATIEAERKRVQDCLFPNVNH